MTYHAVLIFNCEGFTVVVAANLKVVTIPGLAVWLNRPEQFCLIDIEWKGPVWAFFYSHLIEPGFFDRAFGEELECKT